MANKKTTKRSLVLSVLSLLTCFVMLLGTTYAWFTDSVTSTGNIIKTGTLEVTMEYSDELLDADSKDWKDASKGAIFSYDNWEPGYTQVKYIKIENEGSLALKFMLNIIPEKIESDVNLADVIDVYVVNPAEELDRDKVAKATPTGTLTSLMNNENGAMRGDLIAEEYVIVAVALKMQESAGNEYQEKSVGGSFTVQLLATQAEAEFDSFGTSDYDKGAALPWDGTQDLEWYDPSATTYELYTPEAFAGFAALVNGTATAPATTYSTTSAATLKDSFKGKTVKLYADVDLSDRAWEPIGSCDGSTYFQGIFDGQGHTIYGLNVDKSTDADEHSTSGLFGWVDAARATVKNVKIDGATVQGSHWVGAIAGYFTGTIENCTVTNSTVIGYNVNDDANGDKVGGIVGCLNEYSYLNNNTVTNSAITGNRDIGGIAGSVAASTYEMKNNKVSNVTITYSTEKSYASAGEIVSGRTGYVADATNVATNVKFVKATSASSSDELAGALTDPANKHVSIVLTEDVDIPISSLGQQTGGSGEYKLGGEETETITIDLNGHRMNVTTTYWSSLGAKNPDAVFTIKNGTMTSSQATGTWNSYDLTFANCNYVIEDVVFDKAVAFTNAGRSVVMNDVTINETHDYYALWIAAEGQNVEIDGLTVNSAGRGIKIDEQYVDAAAKVTLSVANAKFNTVKKGAIMVKSAAGADIALTNVDITNAKADPVHAVWVDEDSDAYSALVSVTGGKVISEANVAGTAEDLAKAVAAGKTDLWLLPGEYDVYGCGGKTLTISGTKDAVIKLYNDGEDGCDYAFGGNGTGVGTYTFNGITFDTTGNTGNYKGFAYMKGIFNDCYFVGAYSLNNANDFEFNRCTFDFKNGYFWTWGANSVTFNECTFGGNSKNILAHGWASTVITIKDCNFAATEKGYASNGTVWTSAVEIDPAGTNTYTINFIGENTINENYAGWTRIKDGSTGHTITGLN